jgi:exopolysaccharide biosynthesis polyprenyl glycosylphosphotransferase
MLPQKLFLSALALERKRTERSGRRFVLMLLKTTDLGGSNFDGTIERIHLALFDAIRKTDVLGWYETTATLGVIFTEIGDGASDSIVTVISKKVRDALQTVVGSGQFDERNLSFYVYPENFPGSDPESPLDLALYPDLTRNKSANRVSLGIKRCIDIVGSLVAIVLCLPLFVVIAGLIKLTSKGPILFRQQRIGYYGKKFTFLKFRSMYQHNDHTIHKEYVTNLIAAKAECGGTRGQNIFKLTSDPRVTKIGKFLRRTSLDEIPQLFNVLKGEMSLVGPRPPVPYEFAAYATWHRNRLLLVKPGITGLWQVGGRSRVTFDEMVRLDLRYAASWSLWLDLIILLQTPRAVISGQGAY